MVSLRPNFSLRPAKVIRGKNPCGRQTRIGLVLLSAEIMSHKFFTSEKALNEFVANNKKYGGSTVIIDKEVLQYLKRLITLDHLAARHADKRFSEIVLKYREKVEKVHRKSVDCITSGCSVRRSSDHTAKDAIAMIEADEKATAQFRQSVCPLLKLHEFVETLPDTLFDLDTMKERTAHLIMESSIKYCVSFPQAGWCEEPNEDSEVIERFGDTSRIGELLYRQMIGKEVTIPDWSEADIQCFSCVGTGKTKYTKQRIRTALSRSKAETRFDSDQIFNLLNDEDAGYGSRQECVIAIHQGECWDVYWHLKVLSQMANHQWEDIMPVLQEEKHKRRKNFPECI